MIAGGGEWGVKNKELGLGHGQSEMTCGLSRWRRSVGNLGKVLGIKDTSRFKNPDFCVFLKISISLCY